MMGMISRILGREERAAKKVDPYLESYFTDRSISGPVSAYAAENLSAVFACVQIISETIATLPLNVYRRLDDDGRQEETAHPVARLFRRQPNQWQTAPEFIETITAHCLLRGNGYAEIVRDGRGAPIALIPLHPDNVSVVKAPATGRIYYDVTDERGGKRRLLPEEVLHLKDRSDDGIIGKSRLARARETFASAMQAEQYASSVFSNSATMGGVLSHPGRLSDPAMARLKSSFENSHSGVGNAHRTLVLEEGMTWTQVSVSPDDAQMLESRRFGVENIARIFRVPPPVLGDLSNGSYSNVTELGRWFHQHTIMPWLVKWERLIETSLLSDASRDIIEVEFDADLLVRGDYLQRLQGYRIGREVGLYSANDLRKFESLNPRTDAEADVFLSPLNMASEQTRAPKE